MTNRRFIHLIRGYARQARRTRKSFAGAVNMALRIRLNEIDSFELPQTEKDDLEVAALRTVTLEYAPFDQSWEREKES